jgi:hypothetical protein
MNLSASSLPGTLCTFLPQCWNNFEGFPDMPDKSFFLPRICCKDWIHMLARWLPAAINTRPTEWSRAAIGMALGTLFSVWLCAQVFGHEVAYHLVGPLGASAVLLFAVSSGALAQPWSILGGYLSAGVVALLVAHVLGRTLGSACLAAGMALILMCWLRCLHPPAGALALTVGPGGSGDDCHGLESDRTGDARRSLDHAALRPGLQQPDSHPLPQACELNLLRWCRPMRHLPTATRLPPRT